MADSTADLKFSCASCGRTFRWKPDLAGRKAKCSCGSAVSIPTYEKVMLGAGNPPAAAAPAVAKPAAMKPVMRQIPVSQPGGPRPASAAPSPAIPKSAIPKPAIPKPAPPPPPRAEEEETYDIAGGNDDLGSLLPSADALARGQAEAPIPMAAPMAAAAPLQYATPMAARAARLGRADGRQRVDPTTGEIPDIVRNLIVPLAMIVAALAGLGGYVASNVGTGLIAQVAMGIMFALMFAFVALKAGCLIVVAMLLASAYGASMGLLRTAILKLGALIFLTETVVLWAEAGIDRSGALGHLQIGGYLIYYIMTIACFYGGFVYLFRMTASDLRFIWVMGLASRLFNFVLIIVLAGIAGAILAAHGVAAGGGSGSGNGGIAPANSSGIAAVKQIPAAKVDAAVVQRLNNQDLKLMAARDWQKFNGKKEPEVNAYVDEFLKANAANIYVDIGIGRDMSGKVVSEPVRLFIEMPRADADRAKIFEMAKSAADDLDSGETFDDAAMKNRFLELDLQ